jgi:ATP-dependent RNA helicase SUPV3L1/SUV3
MSGFALRDRFPRDHTPRAPVPRDFVPQVKAVLGPTNTGKTHLAIDRMLAHASGIIGFPLRLLARENYDRMVARKGVRNVALITGEEKIVPPEARWFSCTVEAMPLERAVEFVAVDEIQLCADPDRGHVFTDRLLHARGLVETMFLGAETIRPLLHRLVPHAIIETRPRLSQLTYAGPIKLTRLPPRTAVVAFSAAEVYAIAELLRRRRGGCAVVMGRLSPRTRNAQVALYQEKEVDFLVATDAIGMGLNMNVDHVAFASLSKYDGHRPRRLTAAEVAQIAGRAGRGMRDGTFGTTSECPPIPDEIVGAVESHTFEALDHVCWRNSDLDFGSIDALLASLNEAPPRRGLVRGNDASDFETLAVLSRDPAVRALVTGRRGVGLLWDACQVPDFRKLADESHAQLCARIFTHVAKEGALPTDWLASSFAALGRTDGDIDTLMQRLAGVRVWSYIAARADWLRDPATWQGRARAIEDALSDVLHERLMARFVDRRAAVLMRKLDDSESELLSAVTRHGEVVVEGHPVGHIGGFRFFPDPLAAGDEKRLVLRAARRALREEMPRRVGLLEAAPDEALTWTDDHHIAWQGVPVARLRPGRSRLHPRAQILDSEFLDGAARERVRTRVQAYVDARIAADLTPLAQAEAAAREDSGLRGVVHRITEGLGVALADQAISTALRGRLKAIGVRAGRFALFHPALLKPRAATMRARLWSVWEAEPLSSDAPAGAVSLAMPADWSPAHAARMGWLAAGGLLVRLDVAERIAADLAYATRRGAGLPPPDLASRVSAGPAAVPALLRLLGYRVLPAPALSPGQFGPPCPVRVAPLRRRHEPVRSKPPRTHRPDSPFAALADLASASRATSSA